MTHGREWWDEFNVPFEDAPPGARLNEDAIMAGAVVVLAVAYDVPAEGVALGLPARVPGLVFRFVGADGEFMEPIALLLDAEHLAGLKPVICEAIDGAIRAASA